MFEKRWTPPTLITERLILRAVTEADAEAIFRYSKNPNVARHTLWEPHRSIDDSHRFIHDYAFKKYEEKSPEPFGIALRSNPDEIIGTAGCWWNPIQHHCMELGYALSEDYWRKGIASEAARAIVDYCFQNFEVNRIQAHYKSENIASAGVMKKIGMTLEGTLRQRIFAKGEYWDMVMYSILRTEWASRSDPS